MEIEGDDIVCQACNMNKTDGLVVCAIAKWDIDVPESLHPDEHMYVCDEHDAFIRSALWTMGFMFAGVDLS